MSIIRNIEQLEVIYGEPGLSSTVKVCDQITPQYRRLIEAAPFVALATSGPEGLDCSPRGDNGRVIHVADERTLMLPDRRGNNRIDSLRNIVRDPRVGLLFLIPGVGYTVRVNGTAQIDVSQAIIEQFTVKGQKPRSVVVISVEAVYFQCARAIVRSKLWDQAAKIDPKSLPSPGDILQTATKGEIDGAAYDRRWPKRAEETLW